MLRSCLSWSCFSDSDLFVSKSKFICDKWEGCSFLDPSLTCASSQGNRRETSGGGFQEATPWSRFCPLGSLRSATVHDPSVEAVINRNWMGSYEECLGSPFLSSPPPHNPAPLPPFPQQSGPKHLAPSWRAHGNPIWYVPSDTRPLRAPAYSQE